MNTKILFLALVLVLIFTVQTFSVPFAGELDRSFNPTVARNDSRVSAILVQPDGKFVIGGTFHKINNQQVNSVARFNSDGTLDATFDAAGTVYGGVGHLALQPDGKIIIAGVTYVSRQLRRGIARLNADGSFDASFNANLQSANVTAIAVQPDGRILAAGSFTVNNVSKSFLRFSQDGSIDSTFTVEPGFINSIVALPDGKILIGGGTFTSGGQTRNGIARLNFDGTLDTTFANTNVGNGDTVFNIALAPNGKIVIGGLFFTINGQQRRRLARLNSDGTLDTTFADRARTGGVRKLVVQSDGKIIYGDIDNPVLRENADGTLDTDFAARTRIVDGNDTVAVLPDDRILAGGYMLMYNTLPPTLNNTRDQPLALLAADGTFNAEYEPDITLASFNGDGDVLVQPDGKILFADEPGRINRLPRPPAPHIVRFNPDGSTDTSFNTPANLLSGGATVTRLALQADGKIVFGTKNSFTRLVARLNPNGSLDSSFNVTHNGSGQIVNVKILPNGKILIIGTFTEINGQPRRTLALLNSDGSLDPFNPNFTDNFGNIALLSNIAAVADGRFYVGGLFTQVNGQAKPTIARFNADGTLDSSFAFSTNETVAANVIEVAPDGKLLVGGAGNLLRFNLNGGRDASFINPGFGTGTAAIRAIAFLPNGKILVGGNINVGPVGVNVALQRSGYARLNANGTRDNSFLIGGGTNGAVHRIAVQPDGKALIVGIFEYVNNISQPTLARLRAPAQTANSVSDFDGDGRTDTAVFRNGNWFINPSGSPSFTDAPQTAYAVQFGLSTDKLVPADYDGDGKTDIAVWREGSFANFYILNSSNNTFRFEQFGTTGDNPIVVGDFDGDGKADPAVYRKASQAGGQSFFFYRPSAQPGVDFIPVQWGTFGDEAVRGDFDGDGRLDAAVYRPSNNVWYIRQSGDTQLRAERWGLASDKRVAGDFDGDGKTDLAIFRDGLWAVLQSSNNQQRYQQWGAAGDRVVAGDYDGDGRTDFAVWRSGVYYVLNNASGQSFVQQFGAASDVPVASAFVQ